MSRHRALGAVFTPTSIARHLAAAALDGIARPSSVCDPAAGDGRLLAAVADLAAPRPRLLGADLDDGPWVSGPLTGDPNARFVQTDSLGRGLDMWSDAPRDGVDLVVGNPPFLSQLSTATARTSAQREHLAGIDESVAGLVDTAAAFLVAACGMVAPGGRVAMIMPLSFLSSRDAGPARRRVLELCRLSGIWVSAGKSFPDADVETCALLLDRIDRQAPVRRWSGPEWVRASDVDAGDLSSASTWSHLVSDLLSDVPAVEISGSHGRLGDIARATAGFRDQFYGLAPLAREVDPPAARRTDGLLPLITSGAIDPGRIRWADASARIAGRTLMCPAVDPRELEPRSSLGRWVEARRVPKVLVATQTRVVEAVADPTGEWIPSTPVVSVEPGTDDLWRVLAVLLAPSTSVWARRHFAGAALSARAVKLSARQVLDVPLPSDGSAWEDAARIWQEAHDVASGGAPIEAALAAGEFMDRAYGVEDVALSWWSSQLPRRSPEE